MIVVLSGKKRCGKDTVARYLIEKYEFIPLTIAEPLKNATIDIVNMLYNKKFTTKTLFYKDTCGFDIYKNQIFYIKNGKDIPLSWRIILQYFGTEIFKKHFGNDIHIKTLWKKIEKGKKYVITDNRFKNELDYIEKKSEKHNMKVIPIRIENNRNKHDDKHSSEKLDFTCDLILHNETTKEDLYKNIDEMFTNLF